MKLTFLGTGTSQGIPVIGCNCSVCISEDFRDRRFRTSVLVESKTTSVVIDTGPDFRMQMLNCNQQQLDAVIFTHEHKDHVAGFDDIRAFNFKSKKDMEVFCSERVLTALKREFYYIFNDNKYPGVPRANVNLIDKNSQFKIGDIDFKTLEVMHYKLPVFSYRINDLVYITDANFINTNELEKVKGCNILIVNALRKEKHLSHFNLEEALELAEIVKPEKVFLTHISHLMGKHSSINLPKNVEIAYDGLQISF
ncbi:MAG: MBL fold metallo-hydrolase [Flavobacteriales bacterium]